MQLQQRINAFIELGKILSSETLQTSDIIDEAASHNSWFTKENIKFALQGWSEALTEKSLKQWLSAYEITTSEAKKVAIVMAGNIPLVGFHDFLSVLVSGHKVIAKLSSNDTVLLPFLANELCKIEPAFKEFITFEDGRLEDFDAVIATGSNNTARYFDYYFGKYPHIIRRNRNGIAALTGNETPEQLVALSDDIFRYFGLGCRNVSKIFIPKDYEFTAFFEAMYSWKDVINEHKYINNYDYNKAVYLMSDISLLDNEFMLLKEDSGYASPISVVFYEHYETLEALEAKLASEADQIQVVVAACGIVGEIAFGEAQSPQLWQYADGVDTMKFLLNL